MYRILVPALSKLFSFLIPSKVIDWFLAAPDPVGDTFRRLAGGVYFREAAFVLVVMFASLTAFALAQRVFLADLGFNKREQIVLRC